MEASSAVRWIFVLCGAMFGCRSAIQTRYSDRLELTPLVNAAAHTDLNRVRRLIAGGANVCARTKNGETALYEAIERRTPDAENLRVVDALLKAGADPNEEEIFGMHALEVSLTERLREFLGDAAAPARRCPGARELPQQR
jgi:hypothetical protein